ncbi:MAG: DNA translocase FtsK [Verrucomicrobia bacterium]|nr:DNA translocase FtsK [Verrucomicrobiota bacterium]
MPAPARKRSATLARPASESRPLLAIVLGVIGTFLLVAMAFHTNKDSYWMREMLESKLNLPGATSDSLESNPCGSFGASVAVLLFSVFGYSAFLIPAFLLIAAWLALNQRAHTLWPTKVALMSACILFGAPILALWLDPESGHIVNAGAFDPKGSGGLLGSFIYGGICLPVLGPIGTWVLVFPYGFCLLGSLADDPKATLASWIAEMRDGLGAWNSDRKAAAQKAAEENRRKAEALATVRRKQEEIRGLEIAAVVELPKPEKAKALPVVKKEEPVEEEVEAPKTVKAETVTITPKGKDDPDPDGPAKKEKLTPPLPGKKVIVVKPDEIEKAKASQTLKRKGDYIFPEVRLLTQPVTTSQAPAEDFRKRAAELIETLSQFKVSVIPVDPENGIDVGIQQGPSITRYEIKPAPGVRVERIANLSNNIAMNLQAESVRILAPVPGRGTVGIEIPNKVRKDVLLREIIESKAWAESKMEIPVVLGVDSVTNKPVIQDLAKMPHCLIAGSTGQGKSVCINAFIVSLLYRMTPEDLRFIMVDPKVVELQVYSKLPHLLIPVETDPKRVPAALKWLIAEMMKRYKIFAKCGVKNITGFNAKLAKDAGAPKQEELPLSPDEQAAAREAAESVLDDGIKVPTEKLPYIVCVIDEMADLMMVAAQDIETSIARLAQLARAAGIHLVVATQRPSTDVITGLIKANLPTRIAFKVSALVDSRTILDSRGAETLVGRGDMLFIPPGTATLQRVQGAFVGEQEVADIVEFIRSKNGNPEFAQEVVDAIANASEEGGGAGMEGEAGEDPLVAQCWNVIKEAQRASVSMLQRRLNLGYNRAARMMDVLEERGYVGPANGSNPREILRQD